MTDEEESSTTRRIVTAALAILDAEGMAGVTMRRLAEALDTAPGSLYVYVANREELLQLVYDRVLGEIALPPADASEGDWRETLIELVLDAAAVLGRHRGIAGAALGTIPTGPHALRLTDAILGLLLAAGLDHLTAAWAVDLLLLYVTSSAVEHSVHARKMTAGQSAEDYVGAVRDTYLSLPPGAYPNISAIGETLTAGDGDQRVRWSVEVLLNGILATAAR